MPDEAQKLPDQTPEPLSRPGVQKGRPVDEIKKVLEQAGIRKKHLIGCGVTALFAIGLILFFVFGGFSAVKNFFQKEEISKEPTEIISSAGLNISYIVGSGRGKMFDIPKELEIGLAIGTPPKIEFDAGIVAALAAGFPSLSGEEFRQYVEILEKLQNIYRTDLEALLDQSFDRVQTLDQYVATLKMQVQEAEKAQQTIGEERDKIKILFDRLHTEKEQLEKDFFLHLEKLESQTSKEILETFIDRARRTVELKARFASLDKLMQFYKTALERANARLKDIALNYDAIMKGIKVIKVPKSGLKHVIEPEK